MKTHYSQLHIVIVNLKEDRSLLLTILSFILFLRTKGLSYFNDIEITYNKKLNRKKYLNKFINVKHLYGPAFFTCAPT